MCVKSLAPFCSPLDFSISKLPRGHQYPSPLQALWYHKSLIKCRVGNACCARWHLRLRRPPTKAAGRATKQRARARWALDLGEIWKETLVNWKKYINPVTIGFYLAKFEEEFDVLVDWRHFQESKHCAKLKKMVRSTKIMNKYCGILDLEHWTHTVIPIQGKLGDTDTWIWLSKGKGSRNRKRRWVLSTLACWGETVRFVFPCLYCKNCLNSIYPVEDNFQIHFLTSLHPIGDAILPNQASLQAPQTSPCRRAPGSKLVQLEDGEAVVLAPSGGQQIWVSSHCSQASGQTPWWLNDSLRDWEYGGQIIAVPTNNSFWEPHPM